MRQTQCKTLFCSSLFCWSLLSLATPLALAAQAGAADAPPLPEWQMLEYEQQAFFVTARSRMEILTNDDDATRWQLQASSSVASNTEEVTLEMAAADAGLSYRSRLSKGKGERYKTWEYLPEFIRRERRDPPRGTTAPPCEWPLSSRREFSYPPQAAGMAITDAYALPALAARFLASGADAAEVAVNTEFNFYRVRMTATEAPPIKVNYKVTGGQAVKGSREVLAVALQVSPLGELAEKTDFSLLGLNGEITILFDRDSKLPLQLQGNAPRIGSTRINLKTATLRATPG